MEILQEKDCTLNCHSALQMKQILNCVAMATPSQIRSYAVWLCHNFTINTDELGRNLLHLASSCGKWEIVEWLIKYCKVDIDKKDSESGWTALHRSFFYGQLASAHVLCNNGANYNITDREGLTPLDILIKDRLPYVEYFMSNPSEVYVWGSNFNYNLGFENVQSKTNPEILEIFRKDYINIKQVVICKFHSIFLSEDGRSFTCGHGLGGRLGQGNETSSLIPSLVKELGTTPCVQVAAGQDHTLFLLQDGQVLSCGLNTYHQLGHNPPVERALHPKNISMKFLKGQQIDGIRAARYHSIIFTKRMLFTFGLNAGQLGHLKGSRTIIQPKQVSFPDNLQSTITHVETSEGATVFATNLGSVFVLHEYQIRKIASRQLNILKISVIGGQLDSQCNAEGMTKDGALELRIVLLTKAGKIFLWKQTDSYLRRCIFTCPKEIIVYDIHINHHNIGLITQDNEAYIGNFVISKKRHISSPLSNSMQPAKITRSSSGLNNLLNIEECHAIKVKRLSHIYRGISITSDPKGKGFAILQSSPKVGVLELPVISKSKFYDDLSNLLIETNSQDNHHDILIKVGKREFAAHKYILATRCSYFKECFNNMKASTMTKMLTLENILPEAFEQILKFIYTNHCDFLTAGYEVNWNINEVKKNSGSKKNDGYINTLKILQESCKMLHLNALAKRLNDVQISNGKIKVICFNQLPKLVFNRHALSKLSDVKLLSQDGTEFLCHKCILISRLEYFHNMFSSCWSETSHLEKVSLPISSKIMEALLEYLYTDEASKVLTSEDIVFVCHVLTLSDQLLIIRLKEICEKVLVDLMTLKNATELLELSLIYNSEQLKKSCMEFICINLPAIIELKTLDILGKEALQELTLYYRRLIPAMSTRFIRPGTIRPSQEELVSIEENFPISTDFIIKPHKLENSKVKTKSKRRSTLTSETRESLSSDISNKDIILDIIDHTENDIKECNKLSKDVVHMETKSENPKTTPKVSSPGQWIMNLPNFEHVPQLDKIMQEEKNFNILSKNMNPWGKKPLPHLSQKQKKLSNKKNSDGILIPNTQDYKVASCPWAKSPEQLPPSPSFWDSLNKKVLQTPTFKSDFKVIKANKSPQDILSKENSSMEISLDAIQKEEEMKLRSIRVKPLHLINIEDKAIEELLMLYNAKENPNERITVFRILPQEVAIPIWKRHG